MKVVTACCVCDMLISKELQADLVGPFRHIKRKFAPQDEINAICKSSLYVTHLFFKKKTDHKTWACYMHNVFWKIHGECCSEVQYGPSNWYLWAHLWINIPILWTHYLGVNLICSTFWTQCVHCGMSDIICSTFNAEWSKIMLTASNFPPKKGREKLFGKFCQFVFKLRSASTYAKIWTTSKRKRQSSGRTWGWASSTPSAGSSCSATPAPRMTAGTGRSWTSQTWPGYPPTAQSTAGWPRTSGWRGQSCCTRPARSTRPGSSPGSERVRAYFP